MFSYILNTMFKLFLYLIFYIIRIFHIILFYNFVLLYNLYLYFYNNITFSLFINRLLNKVCYLFYFLFLNIIVILIVYSLFCVYSNIEFSLKIILDNFSNLSHYSMDWEDGLPKLSNKHPYLFPAYNSYTKAEYNALFQLELYHYPTVGDFIKDFCIRNNAVHKIFPPLNHKAHINLKTIDVTLEGNGIVIPERLLYPKDIRDIDLAFNTTKRGSFYEYAKKVQHSLNLDYITKEMASGRFDQSKTPLENSYNPEVRKELTFVTRDSHFFSEEFSDEFKSIITAEIRKASLESISLCYKMWTDPEAFNPAWDNITVYGNILPNRTMHVLVNPLNKFILEGLLNNPNINSDMVKSFLQIKAELVYSDPSTPGIAYNSGYKYDMSKAFLIIRFPNKEDWITYFTAKIPAGALLQQIRSDSNCYVSEDLTDYIIYTTFVKESIANRIVNSDELLLKTIADLEAQYYNILEFKKGAGQEYPISLFNHNFFN